MYEAESQLAACSIEKLHWRVEGPLLTPAHAGWDVPRPASLAASLRRSALPAGAKGLVFRRSRHD